MPSFDALHTFAVVARARSMNRAAEQLFLTQSAISRQMRQLETHLGVVLLLRQARGVELTAAGRQFLPAVEAAFDGLKRAVERLDAQPADIKIKLPPTLALRWFLPRLPGFQQQHPGIEIRMSTAEFRRIHFEREDFDAAIVYCREAPPDALGEALCHEQLIPVCAPAVAAQLADPADLAALPLIHLSPDHADWRNWLKQVGASHPALESGSSFEAVDMALNVAGRGLGVAIADPLLITDDLGNGRLLTPFPHLPIASGYSYWLAAPRARHGETALEALNVWLREEIRASLAKLHILGVRLS